MRFAHPQMLLALLALPLLAALSLAAARARRRALERFAGGAAYAARFHGQVGRHRRIVKRLLLGAGLAAAIVAAARPQWGAHLEPIEARGVDVVVLLDDSLSMAAEDIAPSRLAYARHAVDSLLRKIPGDRVALVTFAGQANLVCPRTPDHAAVRLLLDTIEPQAAYGGGTALADGLRAARRAFEAAPGESAARGRAIVVFTDGEDHEGGVEDAAAELHSDGIATFVVGCGSPRGAPIPLEEGGRRGGYKKDREGRVVTTRLEEQVLETLVLATGGQYFRSTSTEVEIDEIAAALSRLESAEYATSLRSRYEERFQIPLLLALVALVVESLVSDRKRSGEVPA
jgi:Ca-activated chloride channel homolog